MRKEGQEDCGDGDDCGDDEKKDKKEEDNKEGALV